jgi:hypothetical protein
MKKAIFMVIISLSLQGFSQFDSGVYKISRTLKFTWENGEQKPGAQEYENSLYLHIASNGYRVYKDNGDVGDSYSTIYVGLDEDGYHIYAVPNGDRFEITDDMGVLFYNFDYNTGWYRNSIEYRGLDYIHNVPILQYEKEE